MNYLFFGINTKAVHVMYMCVILTSAQDLMLNGGDAVPKNFEIHVQNEDGSQNCYDP